MIEINSWLWEGIYTLKQLYDHGKTEETLKDFRNRTLDCDDASEIAMRAIYDVFERTRDYWQERVETETYVFFDPVLDEFFKLCRAYEQANHMAPKDNTFREDMYRAIRSGLLFDDYSYDYIIYDGSQRDGKCKLVLKLYPEFCHCYEVAGGLLEVYDAFCDHTRRLKKELGCEDAKAVALPEVTKEQERLAA